MRIIQTYKLLILRVKKKGRVLTFNQSKNSFRGSKLFFKSNEGQLPTNENEEVGQNLEIFVLKFL